MARVVKKPEVRRAELLDIAERLFLEKGYENTSVKDIYSEANGSFGMFYHHFKSKEEVLEEVNKRLRGKEFHEIEEIVLDFTLKGIDKLRKIVMISMKTAVEGAAANTIPPFQKNPQLLLLHMQDTLGGAAKLLSCVIEDGKRDGTIPVDQSLALSQMIMLFLNVWVNPWIYPWTTHELQNIIVFMKGQTEAMGISLFTEEMVAEISQMHTGTNV